MKKLKIFFLYFYILFSIFNCSSFASVSPANDHNYFLRFISEDVKTSDINLDDFFLHCSWLDSGLLNGSKISDNLFNNDDYNGFKFMLESDTYKYITIFQSGDYYTFILSNDKIICKPTFYSSYTLVSFSSNVDMYCASINSDLKINLYSGTSFYSTLGNFSFWNRMYYGNIPYYYYFSTCGIYKNSSDLYSTIISHLTGEKFTVVFHPYQEISCRLPILSLTHDFFLDKYLTFITERSLLNGKYTIVNVGGESLTLYFIPNNLLNPSVPFGKLYSRKMLKGYFRVEVLRKNSDGIFIASDPIDLKIVSRSELELSKGGIVPFFGDLDVIQYYQVYLPSGFDFNDVLLWFCFDTENSVNYYNSFLSVGSKEISGGTIESLPSGDHFINSSGDSSSDLSGIQDSINDLNNTIKDTANNFLQNILNGIVHLFVPTDEEMSEWLTKTQADISDKLGFLGEPVNFFNRLMNKLLVNNGDFVLHIPDLIIPGTEYKIVDSFDINFNQLLEEHDSFKKIYDTYIIIITGIMIYCFFSYMWSLLDHILGTTDVNAAANIAIDEGQEIADEHARNNKAPIGFRMGGYKGKK